MNCKKIQELILTDYLDQEMLQDKQKELERHIAACADCTEFLALARKSSIEPLVNAKTDILSQNMIWAKIQRQIQAEKQSVLDYEQAPGFLERLKNLIFFLKPRFVWSTCAAIAMLILVFNVSYQQIDFVKNNQVKIVRLNNQEAVGNGSAVDEREEYLSYLLEQDDDYAGYGTALESYFL